MNEIWKAPTCIVPGCGRNVRRAGGTCLHCTMEEAHEEALVEAQTRADIDEARRVAFVGNDPIDSDAYHVDLAYDSARDEEYFGRGR